MLVKKAPSKASLLKSPKLKIAKSIQINLRNIYGAISEGAAYKQSKADQDSGGKAYGS